jgi:glycosyltransferase involved in cell wall biosynthesis
MPIPAPAPITVVTSTRNAQASLADTMLSISNQTGVDIEHVVIDGASTDGTLDVARRLATPTTRIYSEPDQGIYDAFNKGICRSRGCAIAFLNAGDVYAHNRVVADACSALRTRNVDAIFGDVILVDPRHPATTLRHIRSQGFSPARLPYGFMPAHPTMFLRRSAYAHLGGYNPSYRIAGDYEFCLRAFLLGAHSFAYIPGDMVIMRGGGVSNQGLRSIVTVTREMRRACRENMVSTNYLKLLSRLPVKYLKGLV